MRAPLCGDPERLGTTTPTIIRWKERFLANGLHGLDTSHPGQQPYRLTAGLRANLPDLLGRVLVRSDRFLRSILLGAKVPLIASIASAGNDPELQQAFAETPDA